LGQNEDYVHFAKHAMKVKENFNNIFLSVNGTYSIGTQCAQSFPLWLGIVPDGKLIKVIQSLNDLVKEADYHLTVGCFGIQYLFEALTDSGLVDLAYTIANQETFPGYGYMLSLGATTLWEVWHWDNNIYSHNHPMYGAIDDWFYNTVAGIQQNPDSVAFSDILIVPQPGFEP